MRTCMDGGRQAVQAVLNVLGTVEETAKSIPPVDNKASRFGNPAFRTFYDKVSEVRSRLSSSTHICDIRARLTRFAVCHSLPQSCTSQYLGCQRRRFLKSACISRRRGATARASTTEAGWSSTSCVGCACFSFDNPETSCADYKWRLGYVWRSWVCSRRAITPPWSSRSSGSAWRACATYARARVYSPGNP